MSAAKRYFPGTGDGKAPVEKSRFAQTCNRLSSFLKEKRNLRDLSFEIHAKIDPKGVKENDPVIAQPEATTIDLLSNIDNHGEKLPEYVILDSSCEEEEHDTIVASSSKSVISKAKTAQMTIFYGGKVVVLDDVPADRARDMMLVAQNGSTSSDNNNNNNKTEQNQVVELASTSKEKETIIHPELKAKDSDLPIARRASLHKFLAKRKDRANVRAPYYNPNQNNPNYMNMNQSPGASSSGTELSFDLNM